MFRLILGELKAKNPPNHKYLTFYDVEERTNVTITPVIFV